MSSSARFLIAIARDFGELQDAADRIWVLLPAIICYWYRYIHDGRPIDMVTEDSSIGAQFLHMLHSAPPCAPHVVAMDRCPILYAEHEFNASTSNARV